jgi:hypothetical protein
MNLKIERLEKFNYQLNSFFLGFFSSLFFLIKGHLLNFKSCFFGIFKFSVTNNQEKVILPNQYININRKFRDMSFLFSVFLARLKVINEKKRMFLTFKFFFRRIESFFSAKAINNMLTRVSMFKYLNAREFSKKMLSLFMEVCL